MHPEPIPFNQKILGAVGEMLIIGKLMGGMIILEYTIVYMSNI